MKVSWLEKYGVAVSEFVWSVIWRIVVGWQRFWGMLSARSINGLIGGFKMPSIATLVLWLSMIAVPAGLTYINLKIEHAAEVERVKADRDDHWRQEIAKIQDALNSDADKKLEVAKKAEAEVVDPTTDQELIEICKLSASCRSKGELQ
tara:strand:- start:438 stop:881 length:444 start_codon:yes stop_codon:yes gene_type:complete